MFAPSCSTDFAENDTLLNGVENGGIVEEGVIEEAAGFINGVVLPIDGGFAAFSGV